MEKGTQKILETNALKRVSPRFSLKSSVPISHSSGKLSLIQSPPHPISLLG